MFGRLVTLATFVLAFSNVCIASDLDDPKSCFKVDPTILDKTVLEASRANQKGDDVDATAVTQTLISIFGRTPNVVIDQNSPFGKYNDDVEHYIYSNMDYFPAGTSLETTPRTNMQRCWVAEYRTPPFAPVATTQALSEESINADQIDNNSSIWLRMGLPSREEFVVSCEIGKTMTVRNMIEGLNKAGVHFVVPCTM